MDKVGDAREWEVQDKLRWFIYDGHNYFGVVERDYEGKVIMAVHGKAKGRCIDEVELEGLWQGFLLANRNGMKDLVTKWTPQ